MGGAWDLGRWVRGTHGNYIYNGALPPPFYLRESGYFAHTNVLLPQLPGFDISRYNIVSEYIYILQPVPKGVRL